MQEGDTPLASFIEKGLVAAWSAKGKNNVDTDRNILKDLSGQGHDITLYGFAYNDESGYSSKYPNALLFDGKNTYGECTNMPIQTDYTIIAKRRILEKITEGPCFMSKAQTVGVGAFMFELCNNVNNKVQTYSFNQASTYIDPITPITYSTSTNFNGHAIAKGNASDTNYLCLGNVRKGASIRAWHGAFYWAALFNKSLTTEEINEFIKVMETPVGSKINICASKIEVDCMEDTKFNLNTLYFPTDSNKIFFNNKIYNEIGKKFIVEGETDPNFTGEIFNDYVNNTASGNLSHAEGSECRAIGEKSHVEGYSNSTSGESSHAEGANNITEGNCSHVEGTYNETYGKNSHAEGEFNTTDGDSSHAEGGNNSVNGNYSHVEGDSNEVSGSSSHVEGSGNICNEANCCHVEGTNNTAKGNYSHVEGTSNISTIENQHIEGQYSKESDSIHIVGIGTSGTSRKNAHEITLDGQHYIIGVGNYNGTNKESSTSLNAVVAGLDYYSIGDLTKLNENPTQENIITMLGLPNDIRNAIDKGIEIKVNGADNIQSKISAIGIIDAGNVIIKYAYPNQDNWTVIAKCVVDSSGTGWDNESFSIKIDKGGSGSGIDIVQSTGNSQTAVMSQKAVTEALIKSVKDLGVISSESELDNLYDAGIYIYKYTSGSDVTNCNILLISSVEGVYYRQTIYSSGDIASNSIFDNVKSRISSSEKKYGSWVEERYSKVIQGTLNIEDTSLDIYTNMGVYNICCDNYIGELKVYNSLNIIVQELYIYPVSSSGPILNVDNQIKKRRFYGLDGRWTQFNDMQ